MSALTNNTTIRNRVHMGQLKDYKGIEYCNCRPTDIDAFIDYKNVAHIFIELKHGKTPLPYGQRLAYERLADAVGKAGISSLVIVAHHNVPYDKDIVVADQIVTTYRSNRIWHAVIEPKTVKQVIDKFISKVEKVTNG